MNQLSQYCADAIKPFEGFRKKPYSNFKDEPLTIGYGSTHYCDGSPISSTDEVDEAKANSMLMCFLRSNIQPCFDKHITQELTQNQIDALGCLVYNIGTGNFVKSSLLTIVNKDPNSPDVADHWACWDKVNGVQVVGLFNRRKKEIEMYFYNE